MTPPRSRGCRLAFTTALLCSSFVVAQQPMTPEQQAETALVAGQKAFNDGNLPVADQQFKTILQKFPNTPQANYARYGLGSILLVGNEPNFPAAIELFTPPANDGGFKERGGALYQLAVCQRVLGLKELEKPSANPAELQQRKQAADPKFAEAAKRFAEARDWFAGQQQPDKSGRARCDLAEMELRLGKVKEARATTEPFAKDAAFAKNTARPLGLYYHGLACFLDRDYQTAGRSLNQIAPFTDPTFGIHARYLVGRVLHLSGENAEASVNYDTVLADFEKAKKDAVELLKQPDRFKGNPLEKARLDALVKGPTPEYVAGAAFYGAGLNYEAGKFGEALAKFQAFAKEFPTSALLPDATLRAGFCMVQLKQYDEATKLLAPLVDKTPVLADQSLLWLGKAQLGIAAAADPANLPDREAKLKTAIDTLRKAVEKCQQLAQQNDVDAKARLPEVRFELADALLTAKLPKDAAPIFEQLWNEQALPTRREELLQRVSAALGANGDVSRSDERAAEFRRAFPQSVLTPAVLFRIAENSYTKATAAVKAGKQTPPEQLKQLLEDAAGKYREVADKYPEFERVNSARFGVGVCLAQLGNLDDAVKILEAIPAPERTGELATASYLLADCLIRQAPTVADDALAENIIREKLTAASQLLEGFVGGNPKSAEAPAALLKLGFCLKRLGSTLADANERNQTLNRAREVYEKLGKEYPQSPLAGQSVLERAKVRSMMGDKGGAMNDLRAFSADANLQKSPVAPLAALHLATLWREQNNPAEAVKTLADARQKFEGALAQDPERAEWAPLLKYHHGVAILETGKPAEARPLFEQIVQQTQGKPITAEAALRVGQCRIAEGKKLEQDGRQERGQAGNDMNKQKAADQKIQQGRQEIGQAADQLFQRGDQFKAPLPTAAARSRMYYDAAWAWRWLAEDEIAKARETLQKQANGKEVERAKIPVQPSEERSFVAYRKLIDEFPETSGAVDARFELSELLAEREQFDDAVKFLKAALDAEPSDKPVSPDALERIRLRLGATLAAKKDYPAAAAQFDAVASNPKSPYLAQAMYRAGETYLSAGEFEKAIEKLKLFRDKGEFHNVGGISDRAMLRLGQALLGAKKWDEAKQAFETGLQRFGNGNPFAADVRYGVGVALQNAGKYDEAVNAFQAVTAATTAEIGAKSQLQIGQCRLTQKKYADAAAAFLVVPYTYEFPELSHAALLEAARALTDDNKPDQAARVLAKLIKDAPADSEWSKAAKERLDKLKK